MYSFSVTFAPNQELHKLLSLGFVAELISIWEEKLYRKCGSGGGLRQGLTKFSNGFCSDCQRTTLSATQVPRSDDEIWVMSTCAKM